MTPTTTPAPINPGLLASIYQAQGAPALNLTQIDGFRPVPDFTDSNGIAWHLVKEAQSGMSEVPDPQSVSVTDYWNHEIPGSSGKVYIYVVEGIRAPKTNRETPCRIIYTWFSTTNNPGFSPQMIRPQEWLVANVYAAAVGDARLSKLQALTGALQQQSAPATTPTEPEAPAPLIKMEDINGTINADSTATAGPASGHNPGKRGGDNRR